MINILFVCMGNICRSPSAEGFFAHALQGSAYKDLITIDSAGTHSYHVGYEPDSRAIESAAHFDVEIGHLRARKVSTADFHNFDLIIAMDRSNYANLQAIQPSGSGASLKMMMNYHPEGQPEEVPDPYYGEIDGFRYMCELLEAATAGLLRDVEERLGQ
jgi:protein-tyrosine phosphatase